MYRTPSKAAEEQTTETTEDLASLSVRNLRQAMHMLADRRQSFSSRSMRSLQTALNDLNGELSPVNEDQQQNRNNQAEILIFMNLNYLFRIFRFYLPFRINLFCILGY